MKALGPGLLWAGAAVGVSHLVQSTRAGANYGFAMLWVVVVANLFKYTAFEFGPRYAAVMGESLLDGYQRVGKWALVAFLIPTFGTMFVLQAAVTIVTAGLASKIFGTSMSPLTWSAVILAVCAGVLTIGKYPLLDKLIKIIIIVLSLSTIVAVVTAFGHGSSASVDFIPPHVWNVAGVSFMVALIGWMPSAIDISVWHSLWTIERRKETGSAPSLADSLFDFRLGYFGTGILALGFLSLGSLIMYGSGTSFSPSGGKFAGQFISLYTSTLGSWSYPVVAIAALTTMFSTTLTVTDAFPRVLKRSTELVFPGRYDGKGERSLYWIWMVIVLGGSLVIIGLFMSGMTILVDLATTLAFLTAPILAYINYRAVTGPWMPEAGRPGPKLLLLNWVSMVFLAGFALFFLIWRFILN
ncbi:MAG: divalent metal cation transporter [Candidatus Marinimicrobia bacterium]|jgi:Mn2+/Fe2+ NRAMP family transporter|nr:divalent metal cation transporter [Candidatus Neomarinimicrobiota bacterium]MBT3631590.1 divalent metal cation transporter [Candidatus Neomarinimicrobiota bacterium]MBT3824883.1 divalent metal cation transporter [Candidatus Neomarinimicrobiota bacterium]MBT4131887.1 divalent metal cation transporter [Candidatus Neomarinimicrobiota bacterium]MBT4294594.1 divalent metal cation transporter [Candidatus Neomarinimicrobiota bacterium]